MRAGDESDGEPLIVKPDDGPEVPVLGMRHKVDAGHLNGRLLVMEGEIQPGQLIVPHTHTREDECAYLLSGELTYQLGDQVRLVTAGSYVVKPRGIPHAFWNSGTEPARVVEMHVPATFSRFYDDLATVFEASEPGSPGWQQSIDDLNDRYGIVQHWDRTGEISRRYGVGAARS